MLHLWNSLTILALCIALRWQSSEGLILLAHHGTSFHHCNGIWELSCRVITVTVLSFYYYIPVSRRCYLPELFSTLLIDLNLSGKCWAVFANGCLMLTYCLVIWLGQRYDSWRCWVLEALGQEQLMNKMNGAYFKANLLFARYWICLVFQEKK